MELKPSKEVLSTLETVAVGAAHQATAAKKTEKATRKWEGQVERMRGVTSKIQLPGAMRRQGFGQEDWVDVRVDDASGTTLQARRTYRHQERDHRDIDMPLDDETHHRLEIRFAQTAAPDVATEPVVLATLSEYDTHTSLFMRSELGLDVGSVCLRRNRAYMGSVSPADERMVEQALEIEREILDVVVAAQQSKA